MQLEHTFTIAAPVDVAWAALNNPRTVAPCFPGATLESSSDDSFAGTVKVRLGPIGLTYSGTGSYVDRDDDAHSVVIDVAGRDKRGSGTASARVTGSMHALGPDSTEVTMLTDLTITGKPAQFGRGVIADVSEKIVGQFAACLSERLGAPEEPAPVADSSAPTSTGTPARAATVTALPSSAPPASLLALAPTQVRVGGVVGVVLLLMVVLLRRGRTSA
jgi:carbon monoxide dehydrogenase subunit G